MSCRNKIAKWLREDPAFRAMHDDVQRVQKAWPDALVTAHRDETSAAVSFHLHVLDRDRSRLFGLLGAVPVDRMHHDGVTTWHFHGRRPDMNRLLAALGVTR